MYTKKAYYILRKKTSDQFLRKILQVSILAWRHLNCATESGEKLSTESFHDTLARGQHTIGFSPGL